jgi:hypothetical protein
MLTRILPMPEIKTARADIRQLRGLHLWHYPISNCSQRVRVALAEKGQEWHSHPVDLSRSEHVTPDFQALNPKGWSPFWSTMGEPMSNRTTSSHIWMRHLAARA